MRMSRLLVVGVVVLAVAAVLGAGLALANQHRGGSATTAAAPAGPIPYPTGPNDLLLRVSSQGGPVSPEAQFASEPELALYGDGTVVTAAAPPTVPSPPPAATALPDLQASRITPAGVQAILGQVRATGLFGPSTRVEGGVPDASNVVFVISLGAMRRTAVLVGGTGSSPSATPSERAARERYGLLRSKLLGLASWLPAGEVGAPVPYQAPSMAVWASAGIHGATVHAPIAWPLPTPLASFGDPAAVGGYRCGVVTGGELAKLLPAARGATVDSRWLSGGDTYRLLLPGDPGC
jgi:hypothetical protein